MGRTKADLASEVVELRKTIDKRNAEIEQLKKLPVMTGGFLNTMFIAVERLSDALAHTVTELKRR